MTLILDRPFVTSAPVASPRGHVREMQRGVAAEACATFLARVEEQGPFGADERRAMIHAAVDVLSVTAERPVTTPSGSSTHLHLLIEGWAYRAQTLSNGARQITDVLLPGMLFGSTSATRDLAADEIRSLQSARVIVLRKDDVPQSELASLQRCWARARDAELRTLRSRLVSLGCRVAFERVAHFFAETYDHLLSVGLAGDGFRCPLTQQQLGEVLGLTTVHVNRVLQRLRSEGLIVFDRPRVFIPDPRRLHAIARSDATFGEMSPAAQSRAGAA